MATRTSQDRDDAGSKELRLFIPTGRAINPIAKTTWEGVGVVPDVKADATLACEIVVTRARQAAADRLSKGRK